MNRFRILLAGVAILLFAPVAVAQIPITITTTSPLPSGVVAGPYSLTFTATGGVPPYTWSLAGGAIPPGMTFDSGGTLFGSPTVANSYSFTVRATDSTLASTTKFFTLLIVSGGTTQGPDGQVGKEYRASLVALSGIPPFTWDITAGRLPSGLTLAPSTGVISGIPTNPGTYNFDARWTDSVGTTFTNSFTITILPAPLAISTAAALPVGTVGVAYSVTLAATGGTRPYTWSVVGGALPAGITMTSGGVLSGTPTLAGSGSVTVSLTDYRFENTSQVFTWTIRPPQPAIGTSSPLPAGTVGVAYSATLAATGGTLPYTWSVSAGALPAGLTLSAAGALTGTPAQSGTSTFTAVVSDAAQASASRQFVLTINPAVLSIGTTSPLPPGTVGVAYNQALTATGGISPYVWSLASGTLPAGLGLTASGVLSGTPSQAGTFTFTAGVTDSSKAAASKQFTVTVSPAPLSILTATVLPAASAGSAYSQNLAANGGTSPYAWAMTSGTLPAGLSLSPAGVLSGTPTLGGAFSFTIGVTDTDRGSATKAFDLTVAVPPVPAPFVTGLNDTMSPAQQPSIDVQMPSSYVLPVTGTLTLTFTPDAVAAADDPAIQFSSGGRTLTFTIPAGQTRAFPASAPAIQTGTVAGRINLTVRYSAAGQDVTPMPAPSRSIQIPRSAPQISSIQVVDKTTSGFTVRVTGFSTPRQVTQAVFTFTPAAGSNLQTTQLAVPVDTVFTTWFNGAASAQYGSAFLYSQPFQVQGSMSAIASVSVTLSNSTGGSQAASTTF